MVWASSSALVNFPAWRFLLALACTFSLINSEELVGCNYDKSLCDDSEQCINDNLFGRCQQAPFDSYRFSLDEGSQKILYSEMKELVDDGHDWRSAKAQCVLLYFGISLRLDLAHDTRFCDVRKPENIVLLLRAVVDEISVANEPIDELSELEATLAGLVDAEDESDGTPVIVEIDDPVDGRSVLERPAVVTSLMTELASAMSARDRVKVGNKSHRQRLDVDEADINEDLERLIEAEDYVLTEEEEVKLEELIKKTLRGETIDYSSLSDRELNKFIKYLDTLRLAFERDSETASEGEFVPAYELDGIDDEGTGKDKKDEEWLGILDQGTGNMEHRIVTREPVQSVTAPSVHGEKVERKTVVVDGNRIYVKVDKPLTQEEALGLVLYLAEMVGLPEDAFTDVRVNETEVSFELTDGYDSTWPGLRTLVNASEIALIAMKHKKEFQSDLGLSINEVGHGSGQNSFPLESEIPSSEDKSFAVTTLIICGAVVGVLVVVLGVYVVRSRANSRSHFRKIAADVEAQPYKDYEELCRQRMGGKGGRPEPLAGIIGALSQRLGSQSEPSPALNSASSKHSSVSSWSEEPVQSNMDISTGHTILSYMEEHLNGKDLLDKEWSALEAYEPDLNDTGDAARPENRTRNRFQDVLPYDHTRVVLTESGNQNGCDYINASTIYDADPRAPAYIATQGPLPETTADFWQMVWEQGSVVIVNLTKLVEDGEAKCYRYWPESGSEVKNNFEIHLVSEHIWCEDYLVRSFYLKNLRTNETRTVTQFHFLSWPDRRVPAMPKALLEFRRKVNKSYRGRSCPIIVHCSDGAGRAGTYCLLDMVLNRINKGVKEIDIAATLEHIRDQRMRMVMSREQFEFVLVCVAEEVQAIIKALPQ